MLLRRPETASAIAESVETLRQESLTGELTLFSRSFLAETLQILLNDAFIGEFDAIGLVRNGRGACQLLSRCGFRLTGVDCIAAAV